MSGPDAPSSRDGDSADTGRKRRLAELLEDSLPEGTRDERPEGWSERDGGGGAGDDEWLRGEVPPHHG